MENALFWCFLGILVWAPLPFASNRTWAGALLVLLLCLVASAWLVLYLCDQVNISTRVWRHIRWPLLVLAAVNAWIWIQTLALPPSFVAVLSPNAFDIHIIEGWLTLSLDPVSTAFYGLISLSVLTSFLLVVALVNSHRRAKLLLVTLVLSGTLQAVYGSLMVLSGWELGFFVEKYAGQGSATGTFVNRNHLAGYLVMCLAAGIGLLLSQLSTHAGEKSWRDIARRWLALLLSPKIRLRVYLAVMVIALVLTRSRMGNTAFFVSMGIAGAVALFSGRKFSFKILLLLASLFLVDMVILGQWFGLDKVVQRLEQTTVASEVRFEADDFAWEVVQDYPLTGSGGGSFYGVFPNYQGESLEGFWDHAHNDYLEFAADLGIPAALLMVAFVAMALWAGIQLQRQRHTPLYRGVGFTVVMTVCWAAIHSAVDFNLQIPANAVTFVAILALGFVCSGLPGKGGRQ
ncbi:MAG: O-antigen ligase family protein [Pseudomonadales bacterium]